MMLHFNLLLMSIWVLGAAILAAEEPAFRLPLWARRLLGLSMAAWIISELWS